MSFLEVSGLTRYENGIPVVDAVDFVQHKQQQLGIAGATGSGKTTLLKMVAGLVQPHAGTMYFEGRRLKGPEEQLMPGHKKIAYLSQHFELRNHYRVAEMLELDNKLSTDQTQAIAHTCRIDHLLQRKTQELSGGERQRTALALTILKAPSLLLLDEPYSNLDAFHKQVLQDVIRDLGRKENTSIILVSHDATDLLPWADAIIVLENGRIVQQDAPENIYRRPVNSYTAQLFGAFTVLSRRMKALLSATSASDLSKLEWVRPEQFSISTEDAGAPALVTSCRFMGSYYAVNCLLEGEALLLHHHVALQPGELVYLRIQ